MLSLLVLFIASYGFELPYSILSFLELSSKLRQIVIATWGWSFWWSSKIGQLFKLLWDCQFSLLMDHRVGEPAVWGQRSGGLHHTKWNTTDLAFLTEVHWFFFSKCLLICCMPLVNFQSPEKCILVILQVFSLLLWGRGFTEVFIPLFKKSYLKAFLLNLQKSRQS